METTINGVVLQDQGSGCDASDIVYFKFDSKSVPKIIETESLSVTSEAKLEVAVNQGNYSSELLRYLVQNILCVHTLVLKC